MRALICTTILLAMFSPIAAQAQTTAQAEHASGSISSTVTLGGKPAPGVKVIALQSASYANKPVAIAVTDASGHYNLQGLPAGDCRVTLDANAFAGADSYDDQEAAGQSVKLAAGEALDGIDLEAEPGGVITGCVTDIVVNIEPVNGGYKDLQEVVTDEDGSFQINGLSARPYVVACSASGYVRDDNDDTGAYHLAGDVVTADEKARRPAPLIVYLVPIEREHADNAARFAETAVESNGAFVFKNLAPGRYWILVRPLADNESPDTAWPAAVEAASRLALRREAESANVAIDLQPCQRVADYLLRYPFTTPAVKPASGAANPAKAEANTRSVVQ
jgi:hypothetical protein